MPDEVEWDMAARVVNGFNRLGYAIVLLEHDEPI